MLPENFIEAVKGAGFLESQVQVNLHDKYDHSYWFISTFGPGELACSFSVGETKANGSRTLKHTSSSTPTSSRASPSCR